MEYRTKLIISGNNVEIYKNKVGIKIGKRKHKRTKRKKKNDEPKILNPYAIYRARRNIKRIINSNPDMQRFLTLTFAENLTDLQDCNKKIKIFIKKLKRIKEEIKYLLVPEFQKRGAVHYHILINLDETDQKLIADLWGHGFIKIKKIKEGTNVGFYVSKYIGKDLEDWRYFNNKKYFCSRNLNKPIEMTSARDIKVFLESNSLKLVQKGTYKSYYGLIDYELCRIDKK